MSGFNETINYLTGNDTGKLHHFNELTDNMIVIPDNIIPTLIGTGKDLFYGGYNEHSDIGYIIQLNYGGLIYCLLLLGLILYMSFRLRKYPNNQWFSYLFLGTVLICNWKGYFIFTNIGFRLLSILYFYYILGSKESEINKSPHTRTHQRRSPQKVTAIGEGNILSC
jgi:hypothetical protein